MGSRLPGFRRGCAADELASFDRLPKILSVNVLSGMESGTPKSMSNVVDVMALKLAIYVDAPTVGKGFRYA